MEQQTTKVLVVDDNPEIRDIIHVLLEGAKFGSLHPVPCRSVRVQNPHNTRFVKFFSFVSCPLVPSFSLQKL